MTLFDRLNDDLKIALKSGDKKRTGVLRFVLAQLHNKEIEKHGKGQDDKLSNEEVVEVLQREVKKRKEAVQLFQKGKRDDLVANEENEMVVIGEYLPKEMGRDEIMATIESLYIAGHKDFNNLMREAMRKLKGRADGRLVGELVKERIGA